MKFPVSLTEQLMFNSVRIMTTTGSGTGFFFQLKEGERNVPILVTNKHVVNGNKFEKVKILVHTGERSKNHVDDTRDNSDDSEISDRLVRE